MPKRVPEGEKRVPLNCLVSPETKALLEKLKERARSQGEIVDQAVAAWAQFRNASGLLAVPLKKALTRRPAAPARSAKPPPLKPSERSKK